MKGYADDQHIRLYMDVRTGACVYVWYMYVLIYDANNWSAIKDKMESNN